MISSSASTTPSPPASSVSRLLPTLLRLSWHTVVALAVLHLVAQLGFLLPMQLMSTVHGRGHDMDIYYDAALRLMRGEAVYQLWPDYAPHMIPDRFFYSPPFLLLTRPLVALGYKPFMVIWHLAMMVAFWVYCACLSKITKGRFDWQVTLVFGMVLNIVLFGSDAMFLGQFEPVMWMLLALALVTKNRAGWLTLAMLAKIHPIWSLALVLHEGKARAWKQMLFVALPVLALSWFLVGSHEWAQWWPAARPVASQGTLMAGNWSVSFLGVRAALALGWLSPFAPLPAWAKAYLSLCAVGAPLVTTFLLRRQSADLRLVCVMCAGVLFAPLCWNIYLPVLLLPLAVWLGERRNPDKPNTTQVLSIKSAS